MNLSKISKGIAVVAFFLISTILLYVFFQNNTIPFIIFIIGFGLVLLICVYVIIKPSREEWKDIKVIPVKRRR